MKTVFINEAARVISKKNDKTSDLDFYIVLSNNKRFYAFSKTYKASVFNYTKKGVRVNSVVTLKSGNKDIMNLVRYLKKNLPYLVDEYELQARVA